MYEFRICNICGEKSDASVMLCKCGNMLINLPLQENQEKLYESRCEFCGEYISSEEHSCPYCGEKVADDTSENDTNIRYCFVSDNGERIHIPEGESVFGRANLMGEYIVRNSCHYVSELHMTVICSGNSVSIIDNSRNGTYINGVKLSSGIPQKIELGDHIGMGGVSAEYDKYGYYLTFVRE